MRNVHDLDAGGTSEHLRRKVLLIADPGRREEYFTGP